MLSRFHPMERACGFFMYASIGVFVFRYSSTTFKSPVDRLARTNLPFTVAFPLVKLSFFVLPFSNSSRIITGDIVFPVANCFFHTTNLQPSL